MFRTITAKYAGICRRCNGPIAIGDRMRYGGAGRSYHFAKDCSRGAGYTDDPPTSHLGNYADATEESTGGHETEDRGAALTISYGSTPIARVPGPRRARQSSYSRFSSGAEVFTNARGRCEDAPCCGCCS